MHECRFDALLRRHTDCRECTGWIKNPDLNINCAFPTYSTYKLGMNGENKKEICTESFIPEKWVSLKITR